jgi:uncharacterized protein YqgQ
LTSFLIVSICSSVRGLGGWIVHPNRTTAIKQNRIFFIIVRFYLIKGRYKICNINLSEPYQPNLISKLRWLKAEVKFIFTAQLLKTTSEIL